MLFLREFCSGRNQWWFRPEPELFWNPAGIPAGPEFRYIPSVRYLTRLVYVFAWTDKFFVLLRLQTCKAPSPISNQWRHTSRRSTYPRLSSRSGCLSTRSFPPNNCSASSAVHPRCRWTRNWDRSYRLPSRRVRNCNRLVQAPLRVGYRAQGAPRLLGLLFRLLQYSHFPRDNTLITGLFLVKPNPKFHDLLL